MDEDQLAAEAKVFIQDLVAELERKAADDVTATTTTRLSEWAKTLQNNFAHDPTRLYTHLLSCITFEQQLLAKFQAGNSPEKDDSTQLINALDQLLQQTRTNENDKRAWIKNYDAFFYENQGSIQLQDEPMDEAERDKNEIIRSLQETSLEFSWNQVTTQRARMIQNFQLIHKASENILNQVVDHHLVAWLVEQKLSGSGTPAISSCTLSVLQTYFERLAEILWITREQIRVIISYKQHFGESALPLLQDQMTNLLVKLITNSFVVEKQPPQIIKTNSK